MNTVTTSRIKENVLAVPVTKPYNVPDHGPHSSCVCISHSSPEPSSWLRECGQEPFMENRGKHWEDFCLQHLIFRHLTLALIIDPFNQWICFLPVKLSTGYIYVLKNVAKATSVWHPFYHPAILSKRDHSKGPDVELPSAALRELR